MNVIIKTLFASFYLLIGSALAEVSIEREGRNIFVRLPEPKVMKFQADAVEEKSEAESFMRSSPDGRVDTSQIFMNGVTNTSMVYGPSLPQMSFILRGKPSYLRVSASINKEEVVENVTPSPGQPTQARNTAYTVTNKVSKELYEKENPRVEMHYLGDFRGTHLTRVKINVAKYSSKDSTLSVAQDLKVTHNSREFKFKTEKFNRYLIVTPKELRSGLDTFIAWKESKGFVVEVEEIDSKLTSREQISEMVKDYYKTYKVHFVMLVGTTSLLPTNYVYTGFNARTPSDLKYFTFGGKDDYIPDVFHARLVAETSGEVRRILSKSIRYEWGLYSDMTGYQSLVGVASNEGRNPSDNEYISGIGKTFKSNYGMLYTHFYENNLKSNRVKFNQALNRGAAWVTYMGHGSGTSWPSFNQTYKASDINRLQNQDVVQPVIIDVACQNGKLTGMKYIGSKMMSAMDEEGSPLGAVAYYGGSVNISWHPPAIMARGIAIERFEQGFTFLGEGLLLGQLYLAKNWDRKRDVVDNMEWFHLQGDPGLKVRYDQRR